MRRALDNAQLGLDLVPPEPEREPPSDRHLPPIGVVVARSLEAGEKVTLHLWRAQAERTFTVERSMPALSLERKCLRVKSADPRFLDCVVPWADVFYVESEGEAELYRFVDPARLYDLPIALARALFAESEAECRETYRVRESLRRALETPHLFNRAAYTPPFWESKWRQDDTALKLKEASDAPAASHEAAAPIAIGDVVVMVGHRMAGQFLSRDAARVWTIVACNCDLCAQGRHVAVDQPFDGSWRHIARAALRRRSDASVGEGEALIEALTAGDTAAKFMAFFAGEHVTRVATEARPSPDRVCRRSAHRARSALRARDQAGSRP